LLIDHTLKTVHVAAIRSFRKLFKLYRASAVPMREGRRISI
jgi:hypothetical protein